VKALAVAYFDLDHSTMADRPCQYAQGWQGNPQCLAWLDAKSRHPLNGLRVRVQFQGRDYLVSAHQRLVSRLFLDVFLLPLQVSFIQYTLANEHIALPKSNRLALVPRDDDRAAHLVAARLVMAYIRMEVAVLSE
jgi:hypothetical protein